MKRWLVVLLALIVVLGAMTPTRALAHGFGWWGPGVFLGGLALGAALAYPYYAPPYYPYPYPYAYAEPGPFVYAPSPGPPQVQRDVCHPTGCYHLYGDGVSQPWQWVWIPAAPAPPPPSR